MSDIATEVVQATFPVIVTVPFDDPPPTTVVGFRDTLKGTGRRTVRVVVLMTLFAVAVIVADVSAQTGKVVTVKFTKD